MKKRVIAIGGPTASGKSGAAALLAKEIGGEVISADSMQVYKYMDIGTAKVTAEESLGVRHHLLDCFLPDETFNISVFLDRAEAAADDILSRGKHVVVAGGSGLYVDALLYRAYGFQGDGADEEYRSELNRIADEKGKGYLHEMLKEVDEATALEIHPNNVKRVIRALEICKQAGKPKSQLDLGKKEFRYEKTKYYCLLADREELYRKIEDRVDLMIEEGLVEEVKGLLDRGYGRELISMQGLGYKEIVRYLEGEINLEEAVYMIKRDTRHFAKRQFTWFKRNQDIQWIDRKEYPGAEDVVKFIRRDSDV